jgi:uncharacterized repeat protein (TIGR01451 family)
MLSSSLIFLSFNFGESSLLKKANVQANQGIAAQCFGHLKENIRNLLVAHLGLAEVCESPTPPAPSPFVFAAEICNNGIDDDGDGLIDANDPDCGANVMQVIPTGSFVINMGVQPQTANSALKPYGLVWYLLHEHNIPIIWSINSTKTKDGVDFTYNGVDFKGGPFIVTAEYRTPEVDALIAAWQAQGVQGVTTTSEVTVPVNRVLNYSMNWTLNSDNGQIAQAYLDRAGIPSTAYNWTLPQNLDCCTDVFLMPHSEPTWATHNRLLSWNASPAQGGCAGSLWAGCKAGSNVENIVNPANPAQRLNFLMLNPVAPATTPAVPDGDHSDGTMPYSYSFPTHPIMQFLGTLDGAQENGAEQIYMPKTGWRPTTFVGIFDPDHPQVPSLSPGQAAKLAFGPAFGDAARGYVMYQTGHRQDKDDAPQNIAAQRAFFNFSFLAVGQKAIQATSNIPDIMESGTTYPLSASATGGSGIYHFKWETDCGGTFSNPFSANTTYTPPNVLSTQECYIKVLVTDDCGTRVGFQNIFISMRPRPLPPVAVNDYDETLPGVPITVNALANDSDPNMDPITLTSLLGATNTGNGVFVNSGNGQVTYTPDFDFIGTDQINYRICDNTPPSKGGPLCDTATIFITVDWSDANGCYPNQYYGIAAQGNATTVLAQNSITNPTQALGAPVLVASNSNYYARIDNDADYLVLDLGYNVPVGDTIWLHIGSDDGLSATLNVRGTLSSNNYVNGNGFYDLRSYTTLKDLDAAAPAEDVVAYVPTTGAVRRLRFTRAVGAGKPSVNGVRYVDRNCISAVPVANDDLAVVCEDHSTNIDVLFNDSDPQDLPLTISILTQPQNGEISLQENKTIKYQPNNDFYGIDFFTYQICNTKGLCDQANVSITITDDGCLVGQTTQFGGSNHTVADNFTVNAYTSNTGSQNWSTIWTEEGDDGLAGSGKIKATGGLVECAVDGSFAIYRGANLSNTNKAVLTFSVVGHNLNSNDVYAVEYSNNGGTSYALLKLFDESSPANAAESFDLKALFGTLGSNTRVRFRRISGSGGEKFKFDNVQIQYALAGCFGPCVPIPTYPPDAVNDYGLTYVNTPINIAVQSNDVDPSGLGLTTFLGVSNPPDNGSLAIIGGQIQYTPSPGFIGQDAFNYKICNPYGCDSALVTVDVLCIDPKDGRAIQGMVFKDFNMNGALNTGDQGVPNIMVRLFKDLNTNGVVDPGESRIDSALTDAQGNYAFKFRDGVVVNSSSTIYYATSATGSVNSSYPLSNATGASNGNFVKMGSSDYVVLGFANTIPFGTNVTLYLASDKSSGSASISGSPDGVAFSNAVNWSPGYSNNPGNPPPASAYLAFNYQVAATNGIKFIKIARTGNNIYLDAASYKQTVQTGATSTVSLVRSVNSSSDDAEEEGPGGANLGLGGIYLSSSDLEMTQDLTSPSSGNQKIGLRFNTINIPQGAVIQEATLSFRAVSADSPNTNNGTTTLTIKGQAADNAPTFASSVNNISNRALTTTATLWSPSAWSPNTTYTSPDIKSIVQEIVNRPGWADGNSMAFVISGSGSRSASSFDGGAALAPVLNITYQSQSAATATLTATEDANIWIGSGGTTKNYGNCNILYANGNPADRALIKFDISNIPSNATIVSANLKMTKIGGSNTATNFSVHKITNNWMEGTGTCTGTTGVANWSQRQPGINWTTPGGDFNPTSEATISVSNNGNYNWSIPALVQSWVANPSSNYGLMLKFANEASVNNEMEFGSSENSTVANRPQLVINYTTATGPGYYVLQLNPASLPPNSTLTTDNIETAVVLNNGEVDCANNFGFINHLPPVALPDTAYVDAGTSVIINNTVNDSDPEGTPLTMTFLTNPPFGTAVNLGNGTLGFTPNNGFLGWQTFFYSVCDQGRPKLCDTSTVSVLVTPFVNNAPVAQDDYDTTVVNMHVETDVQDNDFDQENDNLTTTLTPGIQQPANGTVSVVNGKIVEYDPNPGFTGDDQYQYIVCDNRVPARCDTARVFIHVKNQPPDAQPDYAETQMNTVKSIPILVNDIEPDGHSIILMSTGTNVTPTNGTTVKGGTVTVSTNGTVGVFTDDFINYTPPAGFLGLDTFLYRVRDSGTPNMFDITYVVVRVSGLIDLELTKTVNPTSTQIGQNVTFTLTLVNKGPTPATTVLTVDKLTPSYQYVSDNGAGAYDPVSGVWYVPTIAVNQTRALTITAKILNNAQLKNVTEVIAADQLDVDSTPDNDDGDQSEDDEDAAMPTLVEVCTNGADDDGDGLVDCTDPQCSLSLLANAGPDVSICVGGSATLTASASGGAAPITFTWSNGLGSGSSKTVNPTGTTTYTVTATSSNGCTATDQVVVTVVSDPAIIAQPASATLCSNSSRTLTVTATGGTPVLAYQWEVSPNGNGGWSAISGATSSSYTTPVLSSTSYYRVVVSANGNGCGSVTSSVATLTMGAATANAGSDVTVCSGISVNLTATGGTTYAWSNGLGSGASKTVAPVSTTTYTVTVTNAAGCTATDQVVVNVNASPVASAGSNVTVCSGTSVNLAASASSGVAPYNFSWNNGLGAGPNKTVTPTATTIYSVTVTGANSCTSVAQVSVNINAVPTANAGADATICQGQTTSLTATGSGAPAPFTFAWSNGFSGGSQTVTPALTTTYTVSVTSSNGCVGTDQKVVNVQVCTENCNNNQDDDGDGLADCADSDCGPSANAGTDLTICLGNTAFLSVGVTGGSSPYTYAWSNGLGSGASKTVSPTATTTYTVTVTSASNCTSTDQVVVTVTPCSENCTNGVDDDGDGLVDCLDPNCAGVTAPVLVPDNYSTCPGMTFSERVTYNDNNLNNPLFTIATNPTHGTVTIDWTGKFIYVPNGFNCVTDQFTYQVCNQSTGCCATANVTIVMGDNTAPQLLNVPADLTISCDDAIPVAPTVTGFDQCPGIYMDFAETTTQNFVGACGSYTITRTWTATDFCGNTTSDNQLVTVLDLTKPELFKVHTMSDGSNMVAGVAQRVTHGWKYVRFPITFKAMPVVLANPTTNSDIAPVVVQVRNISRQGFEVRLREEEAADGAHGNENVSWVAVEPGLSATDLKWEAGTLANVDHLGDTIVFKQSYGTVPIFLPSIITNAQTDPATIRLTQIDNQKALFFEQEETSADAEVIRLNETVGYLAMEPGQLMVDEDGTVIGEAGKVNVTTAWATVNLAKTYTKPVVIISGVTNFEGQPITLRVRNVTSKKFEVRLQEWSYLDGVHTPENISWMVVEGSVPGDLNFYCEGKANSLIPNVNIMALDNCDDLVEFAYDQNSSVNSAGMMSNYSWTAMDDCGNTSLLVRMDTCIVAALRLKANLSGAYLNNAGTNMMRDDLRKEEYIPVVEPFSNMPSYPHVSNDHPKVTICHKPGQVGQLQMEVEATELQAYLADGDEVGSCGLPPAVLPPTASSGDFRTKANGNWNDPNTWLGGVVPGQLNNINNATISIEHNVVLSNDDIMLKNNGKMYITNGSLNIANGFLRLQNGQLYVRNSSLNVARYLSTHSGTCLINMKDSNIKVGGEFSNESGLRRLENVCLEVGGDYICGNAASRDTLINLTATITGKVRIFSATKMHLDNAKFRVINGSFLVESGSALSGNQLTMLLENGTIVNSGAWTANIVQYCVAGVFTPNFLGTLPAVEDCADLTDYFLSCDPDNILDATGGTGNTGSNNNGNNGNTGNTGNGPIAGSEGVLEPTILEEVGVGAVVDWMLLELRDKDNPALIKGYATVLLKRDGSIVSEKGEPVIAFKSLLQGDYLVSIRHRNHLGQMPLNPVFLSILNPPLVDFTDPNLALAGGAASGRIMGGKRFMWGGDLNGDGKVIYQGPNNDVFRLFSQILGDEDNVDNLANYIVPGYEHADFNLDGKVIFQGPNNDRSPLLYNSILVHSSNASMLANYIVLDFIP